MIEIFQAESAEHVNEVRKLFREYENWLAVDLCFQSFEEELANLPGKYAEPEGRLFLAIVENKTAGCIALRKIDGETCEMKRLFVREHFRGLGLGKILIEKLIESARNSGYRKMRLDTLPTRMPQAIRLYNSFKFSETAPYYKTPIAETVFMELNLK